MITKKTLYQWRSYSLMQLELINSGSDKIIDKIGFTKALNERVLRLTQELIDNHLLKEYDLLKGYKK